MFTLRFEKELILIFLMGAILGVVSVSLFNSGFRYKYFPVALPAVSNPSPSPSETPMPEYSVHSTTYDSPDRSKTLVLKKERKGEELTYSASVVDNKDGSSVSLFSKTEDKDYVLSVPFNTWSPDYRYVFIEEPNKSFSVWDTTGEEKTQNVSDEFSTRFPNYILTEVTGWASPNLLVVNTDLADGSVGPSLWFSVETGGFTKLARRFN